MNSLKWANFNICIYFIFFIKILFFIWFSHLKWTKRPIKCFWIVMFKIWTHLDTSIRKNVNVWKWPIAFRKVFHIKYFVRLLYVSHLASIRRENCLRIFMNFIKKNQLRYSLRLATKIYCDLKNLSLANASWLIAANVHGNISFSKKKNEVRKHSARFSEKYFEDGLC